MSYIQFCLVLNKKKIWCVCVCVRQFLKLRKKGCSFTQKHTYIFKDYYIIDNYFDKLN